LITEISVLRWPWLEDRQGWEGRALLVLLLLLLVLLVLLLLVASIMWRLW
jgi:hypothetical protein